MTLFRNSLKFKSLELTGSYGERKREDGNRKERELREIFHDVSAVNMNGYLIHCHSSEENSVT